MNILLEQANTELENLFAKNKNYVSDNELFQMGDCKDIVLNILKIEYGAMYDSNHDTHCNGIWRFHHPKERTTTGYELKYIRLDKNLNTVNTSKKVTSIDAALNEIMRLEFDTIYWRGTESEKQKCIDEIGRNLLIRYFSDKETLWIYVGSDRIWMICPTTYHYIPR